MTVPRTEVDRRVVMIGVDTPDAYCRMIMEGIVEYARRVGNWDLLRVARIHRPRLVESAHAQYLDGFIGQLDPESDEADVLRKRRVKVVHLLQSPSQIGRAALVSDDERAIGRAAFAHLREIQTPHVAFFDHLGAPSQRHAAFQRIAEEQGRPFSGFPADLSISQLAPARRLAAFDRWLLDLPKPVGVFTFSVIEGQALAVACHRLKLRVPEQVAILACGGDDLECHLATPPLSSIDMSGERIGLTAAAMLDDLMHGRRPARLHVFIPPVGVVRRQSTDLFAVDDPAVARALRLISEKACDGLTAGRLIRELGLRRRPLEIAFQHIVGRTLAQQITHVRLERAKRMLVRTRAPLATIASYCGFAAAPRLSEAFKRETGITPMAYRREHRPVKP